MTLPRLAVLALLVAAPVQAQQAPPPPPEAGAPTTNEGRITPAKPTDKPPQSQPLPEEPHGDGTPKQELESLKARGK
ncbi:MAG TPA: hypothetical protein VIL72_06640 [Beijerinckiaceae bacterium]